MHQVAALHCGTVHGANSKNLCKVSESEVLGNKMQPPNITLLWLETRPVYELWCVGSLRSATVQRSALSHNPATLAFVTRTFLINHNSDKHLEERIILVVV